METENLRSPRAIQAIAAQNQSQRRSIDWVIRLPGVAGRARRTTTRMRNAAVSIRTVPKVSNTTALTSGCAGTATTFSTAVGAVVAASGSESSSRAATVRGGGSRAAKTPGVSADSAVGAAADGEAFAVANALDDDRAGPEDSAKTAWVPEVLVATAAGEGAAPVEACSAVAGRAMALGALVLVMICTT